MSKHWFAASALLTLSLTVGLAEAKIIRKGDVIAPSVTTYESSSSSTGSSVSAGAAWLETERVSLLAKGTPIAEVVRLLPCGVTFENVEGLDASKVTANLRGVSLKSALDAITAQAGMGYEAVSPGLVKMYKFRNLTWHLPVTPLSETYAASMGGSGSHEGVSDRSGAGRNGSSSRNSSGAGSESSVSGNGGLQASGDVSLAHRATTDLWTNLATNLKGMVGESGIVTVDPRSSMVFVRCPALLVHPVEDYMKQMIDALLLSVEVEVAIIDVTTRNDRAIGIDWEAVFSNLKFDKNLVIKSTGASSFVLGDGVSPFNFGITRKGSNGTQSLLIKLLHKYGDIKVVEKTTLCLRNNTAASMRRGENVPYIDSINTTVSEDIVSTEVVKGNILSGVDIGVMANVFKNHVSISLTPRVTELLNIEQIDLGKQKVQNPRTRIRENLIQVFLEDGQTAVVAGVKSSKNGFQGQGIPGLTSLPVLGPLFGVKDNLDSGGHIVLLVTPKIIRPDVEF